MIGKRTTRTTVLLVLALALLLVGPVQATGPRAPGMVAVTWQLTVNGTVPAGEFLYVEYSPRSSAPGDDGFAHFCGPLFQIDTKPACQGNGTVYTETVSFPVGTTVTFSFERSNQSTSTGGGDPYEIEIIQQGSRTLNADVTISATYSYQKLALYVPLVTTAPQPATSLRGTLAYERNGNIHAYSVASKQTRLLITNGRDMQYSPDGTQLAFVRDDGLYLAAADGTNTRRIAAQSGVQTPRWSDDGAKLVWERASDPAASWQTDEIWTVAVTGGTPTKIAAGSDPAWAPDSLRIAYVTVPNAQLRNQLRVVNWQGQNDRVVVSTIPPNTPPIGIPGNEIPPDQLGHGLRTPVWNAQGTAVYASAEVGYQVETVFNIWERADTVNGGSVFLDTLFNVISVTGAPDRRAALVHSALGQSGADNFEARSLNPNVLDAQYAWAEAPGLIAERLVNYASPAWSPDSNAVATLRCPNGDSTCDLIVLAPGQAEPQVLLPNLPSQFGSNVTWGRGE